ncbi:MAG TPA: type II secretion system protein GspJ [Candidatus Limnocylindrales bacterium]|nr:type II secretion system protein GspJ [Candidatus Limnocylindrales bacterium]
MPTSEQACASARPPGIGAGRGQRGFTLLELIIAMAVFALVSLGIYGVLVLGARSAGSGERITEQARRYRMANEVLSRQIASAAPLCLPKQKDDDELGFEDNPGGHNNTPTTTDEDDDSGGDDDGEDDEDGARSTEPFFYGDVERLEFITTAPQRPDASGMAIVSYWLEDGTLRMSERPVFSAYQSTKKLDKDLPDDTISTILLYDVESLTFAYQRESDSEEWLDTWDASDDDQLPATVRIDVKPSAVGGPDFYHEVAVMVGTFNQIADADGEFRCSGGGG